MRDYRDVDKRDIKQIFKECNHDVARCRVAINNAIMEDCRFILLGGNPLSDAPLVRNARNNDRYAALNDLRADRVYVNEGNFNTSKRQICRSENAVRRNVACQRPCTLGRACLLHDSRGDQDVFDKDESSQEDHRSLESRDDPIYMHADLLDCPRSILVQSEKPIRNVTVYERPCTPGRACLLHDSRGDQDNEKGPVDPGPVRLRSTSARAERRGSCYKASVLASHPCSWSSSPHLVLTPNRCICIHVNTGSSSSLFSTHPVDCGTLSRSRVQSDQVLHKTQRFNRHCEHYPLNESSRFLHPSTCLRRAERSVDCLTPNTELKKNSSPQCHVHIS
ncbi:hypothetical protein TcWFU_001988 [Taenia crassiceps]|uniref:Uncharacterized protein n=1 Tax=Taenia crassiceps TaxID=6207 RepID=A0ABR4Q948_9CEST